MGWLTPVTHGAAAEMPVRIFGTASASTKVTVELQGKIATGTAAADGRWEAHCPP